jgi:hypothetical protein
MIGFGPYPGGNKYFIPSEWIWYDNPEKILGATVAFLIIIFLLILMCD